MADKTPVDALATAIRADDMLASEADAIEIATWHIRALEAAGYRIVPLEPTEAMVKAAAGPRVKVGDPILNVAASIARLAIAAAPTWGGKDG